MTMYEKIAQEFVSLIERRVLRAGDRLPSVRLTTRSHQVNPGTVLHAYRHLEAQGLIESRPRSGYYVRKIPPRRVAEPTKTSPNSASTPIVVGDLIVELVKAMRAPHMIPLGLNCLNPALSSGEDLNRAAARAVRRLKPASFVHDLTPGNPALRRLIALRYVGTGNAIADEDITIMNGGREAVVVCIRALTRPGDTVAIETPNAWPQLAALEGLGLRVQEIATHCHEGVDLTALERAFRSGAIKACLIRPTFQNPLGCLMSDAAKRALAKLVARYQIPLIESDPVPELYYGLTRPRPVKAFDEADFVLHCGSFATCVAPAYQIGWIATRRYRGEVAKAKILLSLTTASACQSAMVEYLAHGPVERHLRRLRHSVLARYRATAAAVADYFPGDCRMTQPAGGFLLWVELPKGTDSLKLYRLALAKGVSFAPGPMFSARHEYTNCLRLNFGYASVQQIREGVRTIAQLIGGASS
jgi:DNA-binding transcriptional MocR family regulator